MFETLTIDELKSLMAALITRHGYSSNKMTLVLAASPDYQLHERYVEIATEIGHLYSEVSQTIIAKCKVAA